MAMEKKWCYVLTSGEFYVEIKESMLRRMDYGGTSTYVDPELVYLAIAHGLEKSYKTLTGDKYQVFAYIENDEEHEPRTHSYTGPVAAPRIRAMRSLGVYLGESDEGVKSYGVLCYDEETVCIALPSGEVLYMWRSSFRSSRDYAVGGPQPRTSFYPSAAHRTIRL